MSQKLDITRYTLDFSDLPESFDGFRIAQVSDVHGDVKPELVDEIRAFAPDVIFCTGDIFDGVQHSTASESLLKKLLAIAPVYFVSGNHEYYLKGWPEELEKVKAMGVCVLENKIIRMERGSEAIEIAGLSDPDLDCHWSFARRKQQLDQALAQLPEKEAFRLMLFHRADLFDEIHSANADLTFSGHLHGGQWRFFGQGLLGPNNGDHLLFLPEYDAGLFEKQGQKLIVSRGLGDQMWIPRLFNRPELVFVTLHCQNKETERM